MIEDYLTQPIEPDPVIDAYKKDVDVTLLVENLKLTPAERLERMAAFARFLDDIRGRAAPPEPQTEDAPG